MEWAGIVNLNSLFLHRRQETREALDEKNCREGQQRVMRIHKPISHSHLKFEVEEREA